MELYDHQKKILNEDPKKCGLFLGTGSAKTAIALHLAYGKTLVIAPKTQKEDRNWEREKEKWGLSIDLTVISKETLRKEAKNIERYNTIIVDEAHTALGVTPNIRWKNKQPIPKTSQLFEELYSYIKRTSPERIYLCTATIVKSPMTVWGATKILGLDFDFYKWRNYFYTKLPMPGREVWVPKKDKEVKEKLASIVKKMGYVGRLEDYFDVPDQTFKTIYLELKEEQKERIKELKTEYPDPIVYIGKRHQIENGVLSGDEFSNPEYFSNEKMDKIVELSEEFSRIIIFAKYRSQIEQIASRMHKEGKKVFILTGDTKDRGKLIFEANNSEEYVFIAQAQISAGWEIPKCPVMLFASMTYSYVDYAQGLGRILRANNLKKNLYIHLIVKGGIDEAVYKNIINKQDFDEKLYVQTRK